MLAFKYKLTSWLYILDSFGIKIEKFKNNCLIIIILKERWRIDKAYIDS